MDATEHHAAKTATITVDATNVDHIRPLVDALVRIARLHGSSASYQRAIAREALAGIGIHVEER